MKHGEFSAPLGTNGAGKTSTVQLLEGSATSASDRVRVLGHDPCAERAVVRPRTGCDAPGRRLPARADRRRDRSDAVGPREPDTPGPGDARTGRPRPPRGRTGRAAVRR
ncbi:hypothetical protein ACF061_35445 [Streptomyces sp. NPDC015220]|uniref:hypothetical protein n=1 Tax=Streptomyces sp. NPDC015220 TaxID=3364947 RepID=UPI0036FAFE05